MARNDARRKSFGGRLFLSLLRAILVFSLLGLFILLCWRMCAADSIPAAVRSVTPNEAMTQAYGPDAPKDTDAFYQSYGLFTYNEEAYGYFSVPQAVFFPGADQLQVVIRYNVSTLKKITADYALDSVPNREEDLFDYTVVLTDGKGNETRFFPAPKETRKYAKGLYVYYRLTFPGAVPTDGTEGVFIDFYYRGTEARPAEVDYSQTAMGAVCLYENIGENIPFTFSRTDKAAIADFVAGK